MGFDVDSRDTIYVIDGQDTVFDPDDWPGDWAPCLPPPAQHERDARQSTVLAWTRSVLGEALATGLVERGARLVEEAIETFQAAGGSEDMVRRLAGYVFARPVGDLGQEIGGVGVCALALAAAAGLSAESEEAREVARVLAKSPEDVRRRTEEKTTAGLTVPSTVTQTRPTWTGPDGTVYDVVPRAEVGDRRRWWVWRDVDELGTDEKPAPNEPRILHTNQWYGTTPPQFALVLSEKP